jgi:hypothetical protein
LATIITVKEIGKSVLKLLGRNESRGVDVDEERDDADSRFLDKCKREEQLIRGLPEPERSRALSRLQRKMEEYERNRT